MCRQILMNKHNLPVNHVDAGFPDQEKWHGQRMRASRVQRCGKIFIAAFGRMVRGKSGGKSRGNSSGRGKDGGGKSGGCSNARKGQRCTNCGADHRSNDCSKPIVDEAVKPCWIHSKAGHTGRTTASHQTDSLQSSQ